MVLGKRDSRAAVACEPCRKRKVKCDGDAPCSSCRITGVACRYTRPRMKRPLVEQVDHIEALVERILEDNNLSPGSDDDSDEAACDLDPEFGTRAIRINPMDDPIYTSQLSCELLTPRFLRLLSQRVPTNVWQAFKDNIAALLFTLFDIGIAIGPLYGSPDPEPKADPAPFLKFAYEVCKAENHSKWEGTLSVIMYPGEFATLSPVGDTAGLYYAYLSCVMSCSNPSMPLSRETALLKEWCLINGIRNCIRDSNKTPTCERLRAILLLFLGSADTWLHADSQVFLSRVAVSICRALGLNRMNFYMHCPKEKRMHWASLFWNAYSINRSLALRYGSAPAMDSGEISLHLPEPHESAHLGGLKQFIDLCKLFDSLWDTMCSGAAEKNSVRQLVRHSLNYLKDLDNWWRTAYPHRSSDTNPSLIFDEMRQMYQDDGAVLYLQFNTLSSFYYIKILIYRMCALTPASVQDHLTAMFPAEVASLKASNGVAASDLQARIASVMSSNFSLQKAATQCLKVCIAFKACGYKTASIFIDILNASAAMTLNVILSRLDCARDAQLLRKVAEKTWKDVPGIDTKLLELYKSNLLNHADIIDECVAAHNPPATPKEVKPEDYTPEDMPLELLTYDAARTIEDELMSYTMNSADDTSAMFSMFANAQEIPE